MNLIAVDDKKPVLEQVMDAIREAAPGCVLAGFHSAEAALDHAKGTRIDAAFLDIDMPGMSGLELAKGLKEVYGKTNIIFVTGYAEYAVDAFGLAASGYILKPAEPEAIARELERLRYPAERESGGVRIECFGNFNVFADGEPVAITRRKAKEMLAYLVHKRGEFARPEEIASVLWEDKSNDTLVRANVRQVSHRLAAILKAAGLEGIIIKKYNGMAVDVTKFSCDYYDFIGRNPEGINAYNGEYLNEYSWGEFEIGKMVSMKGTGK